MVPAVPRLAETVRAAVAAWPLPARVVTDPDEKLAAFRTARAALTKSGTSTLELALAGVPDGGRLQAVSLIEAAIGGLLIRIPSVILANLVLGEAAVPEFLQSKCTPQRLAAALLPLMADTPDRQRQVEAFARLDGIMEIGQAAPSDRAAAVVLEAIAEKTSF